MRTPYVSTYNHRRTTKNRARVGAEWLDTVLPDWFEHITLPRLMMSGSNSCILGQLSGVFTDHADFAQCLVSETDFRDGCTLRVPESIRGLAITPVQAVKRGFLVETDGANGGFDYPDDDWNTGTKRFTQDVARAELYKVLNVAWQEQIAKRKALVSA